MNDPSPTVSARLMDANLDQPYRMLHKHFRERGENDVSAVAGLLRSAYAEGVRDGFQRGIMASDAERSDGQQVSS